MKSLITVQKWVKAFKIICTVFLVLCIVGAAMSALLLLTGENLVGTLARFGTVTVNGIADIENMDFGTVRTAAVCGIIECLFTAAVIVFAVKYLGEEQKNGTPFTHEFAGKMRTLAILSLVLPIASDLIVSVIGSGSDVGFDINIAPALALFAASAVFRYGADILDRKGDTPYAEN